MYRQKTRFLPPSLEQDDFRICAAVAVFRDHKVRLVGEENRAEYVPYNRLDDIHDVVLAYDGDIPVGSAAFKKYDDECAEVKRVFVKQEYRDRGISKKLMELLEDAARKQGYRHLILESGEALAAAMALYRKIGYKVIPNYGQYKDMPDSVCMKKNLYIPVCEVPV